MLFYRLIKKLYSTLIFKILKNKYLQQRYHFHQVSFTFLCIIFSFTILINCFSTTTKNSTALEIYDVYKSTFIPSNESIALNIHNHSIHHIYIDIGCFNGESIEHFIYFTPNSSLYDIITFEPDPTNYQLCKRSLTQKKYENFNIIIIPKVVWIRNEKVAFQTKGENSRIDQSKTKDKNNLPKLDAIDFSSWLSHLIKRKQTKLRMKITMPGAEVKLLRKMITDGTFELIREYDIEWTDRSNPHLLPSRLYVQSMFDSLGYGFRYFTQLPDLRRVFQINGTYANVKKYYSWTNLPSSGVYSHYIERPDVIGPIPTLKTNVKLKKI